MISKSETADILERMATRWPSGAVPKVKTFKVYEVDAERKILVSDEFTAVQVNNAIIPFLGKPEILARFPSVTVDMGAVKFVCNGAKVLRPGIVDFAQFKKGDIVVV